jgi:pimeloyl-ACP methyl ester carboxylesterase
MQFAYQFPHATERLVLVSSGGLGRELTPLLRAAALPGAELFIGLTAGPARVAGATLARALAAVGLEPSADMAELARGYASLADAERRSAFLTTLRGVVDTGGQRLNAIDRLYLAGDVPVLIVWGSRDPIIPVAHAHSAQRAIAGSRLAIFEGVGHMPQVQASGRFLAVLESFLEETAPAPWSNEHWRARLSAASRR